jgi:hypothetical protein
MSFTRTSKTVTIDDEMKQLRENVENFLELDMSKEFNQRNWCRTANDLRKRVAQLKTKAPRFHAMLDEMKVKIERAAIAFDARFEETQPPSSTSKSDATQEQLEIQVVQEQDEHLRMLSVEIERIVEESRIVNELSHEVRTLIDRDHAKIQHVEAVVSEAKGHMVEGNRELSVAEEHQQKTCVVA